MILYFKEVRTEPDTYIEVVDADCPQYLFCFENITMSSENDDSGVSVSAVHHIKQSMEVEGTETHDPEWLSAHSKKILMEIVDSAMKEGLESNYNDSNKRETDPFSPVQEREISEGDSTPS